jgi:divalent metal cation (Fe/Co/Zn/Cd) transporter
MQKLTKSDEDSPIPSDERAPAASRSTWVSVEVIVALSSTQIAVGVLSKSQGVDCEWQTLPV